MECQVCNFLCADFHTRKRKLLKKVKGVTNKKERTKKVLEYVKTFCVKYANIVKQILEAPGTVFLYSGFLWYGVKSIATIFTINHY